MDSDGTESTAITEQELDRLARTVINDIPDAVIYADPAGIIRFWNDGASRIFGFSTGEAVGSTLDLIIPERLRERHWKGFRRMMQTGRTKHEANEILSVPAQTKSGATLSIQFTVAAVHASDGRILGVAAVLRDVTQTFQELKRLRANA